MKVIIFIPFLFTIWSGLILALSIVNKIGSKNAQEIISWKTALLLVIFVFALDWSYQLYSAEGFFRNVISFSYFLEVICILSLATIGTIFIIFTHIKCH